MSGAWPSLNKGKLSLLCTVSLMAGQRADRDRLFLEEHSRRAKGNRYRL